MTLPRQPRPHDAIDRRIDDLEAAQLRHWKLTKIARLEREVAALPDPTPPNRGEGALRASDVRIQALLDDLAKIRADCEPDERP